MSVHLGSQAASDDALVGRVVDDFVAALDRGEHPQVEDVAGRYPEIGDVLREVLAALEFVRVAAPPAEELEEGADSEAPLRGTLGDFRILREVGRGGMGVVYEAEQISLGRRVALKVLPFAAALDAKQLQRFKNEAQAAAGLHHTNIVPVYYVGSDRGVHYYAMQYIDGQTLAQMIAHLRRQVGDSPNEETASGPCPPPTPPEATAPYAPLPRADRSLTPTPGRAGTFSTEHSARDPTFFRTVASLGIQAAQALEHAHQLGVIHRDIKPGNLLLETMPLPGDHSPGSTHLCLRLWVTDFGLAHCRSQAGPTMTGDLVGTLRYMSPEQALARRVIIDHRTDIYSLGATLYELLTLHPVFGGSDREELLRQIAFEETRPPRRLNKAVPAELETIVLKALEKNPADRFLTAQELADDLERFLKDEPIWAKRPSLASRARKWTRRHKPMVWAATTVAFLAALTAGAIVLSSAWERAERRQAVAHELDRAVELEKGGHWAEARLALERAEARLAAGDPEALRRGLEQVRAELELVVRLEAIRAAPVEILGYGFNYARANREYQEEFHRYGLDLETLEPAELARLITESAIKDQLVEALDDWVNVKQIADVPGWERLLAVARLADPDPWRNRLRQAALGKDRHETRKTLAAMARDTQVSALPPATAALLASMLSRLGDVPSAIEIFRQAHVQHESDFWINLGLAYLLMKTGQPAEAEGFYRAVLALRPDRAFLHSDLSNTLFYQSKYPEAEAACRHAIRLQPRFAAAHSNLGDTLRMQGKLAEAEAECREAIRLQAGVSPFHVNLGAVLGARRRFAEAEVECRKAIALKPDDAQAYVTLGHVFKRQGKFSEAETNFRIAIKKGLAPKGRLADAHYRLGAVLCSQDRFAEAEEECRKAIALKPDDPLAYNNLGAALKEQGKLLPAEAASRKAIDLKPGYAKAHLNLGIVLRAQGKVSKARDEYEKAIHFDRNLAEAYTELAAVLAVPGTLGEAEAHCFKAIELQPEYAMAYLNLGNIRRLQGKEALAETAYRRAIALDAHFAAPHYNLGVLLHGKGDREEAINEFKATIAINSRFTRAYLRVADLVEAKGDLDGAIRYLQAAVAVGDKNRDAQYTLANALRSKRDWDGAIHHYQISLEIDPTYSCAHNNLGSVLHVKGDLAGAMRCFKAAIKCDGQNAKAHYNVGHTFHSLGNLDGAVSSLKTAIALEPKSLPAHVELGNALAHKKEYDQAIGAFRAGLVIDDTDVLLHLGLGRVLLQLGQFAEAAETTARAVELAPRSDPRWLEASQQLHRCKALLIGDARLTAVLQRKADPANALEALRLAWLAQQPYKQLPAAAARLYHEAFAADPKLADDLPAKNRYNAAGAAALAACGLGKEAAPGDQKQCASWRRQALDWLRADLTQWAKLLEEARAKAQRGTDVQPDLFNIRKTLEHWQRDPDLASVRGEASLARLPEAEQLPWHHLWADVENTLAHRLLQGAQTSPVHSPSSQQPTFEGRGALPQKQ
jgi:tetratricopeptide (TPR) repeat protein